MNTPITKYKKATKRYNTFFSCGDAFARQNN